MLFKRRYVIRCRAPLPVPRAHLEGQLFYASLYLLMKTVSGHLGFRRCLRILRVGPTPVSSFEESSPVRRGSPIGGTKRYRLLVVYFTVLAVLATCLLAGVAFLYVSSGSIALECVEPLRVEGGQAG